MKRTIFYPLTLSVLLVCGPSVAFDPSVPAQGLPSAIDYGSILLPDRAGIVSWKTLAKVEPISDHGRIVSRFDPSITELDRTIVRVQGFMLPMDLGDMQHHFLISAVPPHCPFCLPAGPDALMEVRAKKAVAYSLEPVLLSGKFIVVRNDSYGLLYQLVDADVIRSE